MDITARLNELLCASVEEYVKSANPVTSLRVASKKGNDFCSATIRNDLRILDQMGYLRQIHTSGGRVPTINGYKAYIDASNEPTFVGDIVNDLYALTLLAERIQRKLGGCGNGLDCTKSDMNTRRQNIQQMIEIPGIEMSTYYLVIKEKLEHGRG